MEVAKLPIPPGLCSGCHCQVNSDRFCSTLLWLNTRKRSSIDLSVALYSIFVESQSHKAISELVMKREEDRRGRQMPKWATHPHGESKSAK